MHDNKLPKDLLRLLSSHLSTIKKLKSLCGSERLYYQFKDGEFNASGILIGDVNKFMIQRNYLIYPPNPEVPNENLSYVEEIKELFEKRGITQTTEDDLKDLHAEADREYEEYIRRHHKP